LFTFANQAVLGHPTLAAQQKVAVLALIQDANIGVHAGQELDIVNVLALEPNVTPESLQQTDYLKTAVYSVHLPMQVAATLVDVDEAQRQKIDEFAKSFGILYQLVDDYSDYFVNDSSFNNHPKYRDYQQGKITYPLLFALGHASEDDVDYLKEHAGKKQISEDVLARATEILDNCGAKAASQEQINTQYEKAVENLAELAIDNTIRAQFIKMLDEFKL
jgi:octaprenyl-diphosphate synthase